MNKLKLTLASFAIGAILMAAPMAVLACSSRIGLIDYDNGGSWTCYLTGEDSQYCYYDCYANQ